MRFMKLFRFSCIVVFGFSSSLGFCEPQSISEFQDSATQSADFSTHIKILASSCAACHGTNGNSVSGTPVLAGLDASHFVLQMNAFRNGERSSTVMHRHAKGLQPEEILQLAAYFAAQKRMPNHAVATQKMELNDAN